MWVFYVVDLCVNPETLHSLGKHSTIELYPLLFLLLLQIYLFYFMDMSVLLAYICYTMCVPGTLGV